MPRIEAQAWAALVTGVRDYLGKNGFPGAIIGLSGGIDSALVLAIAVDALGADRVRTVMMPSPYTADISWIDARDMAAAPGRALRRDLRSRRCSMPSAPAWRAQFAGLPEDTTEENIQARIRGTLLMALSNKFGAIVLTTGNKSEMATGYCTLYGDMAGGFAVIKDVAKTLVYRLARLERNRRPTARGPVIPERIITRAAVGRTAARPDRPGQPAALRGARRHPGALHGRRPAASRRSSRPASTAADVERVTRLIKINEYKRRQAPVGIRITHRAFGRDWRYPITSKFRA